jgi:hypothetical protein
LDSEKDKGGDKISGAAPSSEQFNDVSEEIYASLRKLHLWMSLFNLCFSDIVFLAKILILTQSILSGFATIRLATSHPTFALVYASSFLNCIAGFIGIFDMAYGVTTEGENLKRALTGASMFFRGTKERTECRVKVESVPRLGIEVGGFYPIEREATPIFLDFISNQISSLLITF